MSVEEFGKVVNVKETVTGLKSEGGVVVEGCMVEDGDGGGGAAEVGEEDDLDEEEDEENPCARVLKRVKVLECGAEWGLRMGEGLRRVVN